MVYKKEKISLESRIAAPWPNYTHYIKCMQQFIKAERTSNFALQISTTKQMINVLATSAPNNYAKTCFLYLQSIEVLEKDHPNIFEQFVFGNHTVRPTDLSIYQKGKVFTF